MTTRSQYWTYLQIRCLKDFCYNLQGMWLNSRGRTTIKALWLLLNWSILFKIPRSSFAQHFLILWHEALSLFLWISSSSRKRNSSWQKKLLEVYSQLLSWQGNEVGDQRCGRWSSRSISNIFGLSWSARIYYASQPILVCRIYTPQPEIKQGNHFPLSKMSGNVS